jgi:DNA uptake protein ComE-like DNA-binding protein
MPTQSEQKALAFVAIVVLLAGAVRVVRAGGPAAESSQGQQQGLARQAFAANSAAVAQKAAKDARAKDRNGSMTTSRTKKPRGPRFVAPRGRDTAPNVVGGVSSVPWNDRRGFPPPVPRIDSDGQAADTMASASGRRRTGKGVKKGKSPTAEPAGPIDLDSASPDAIETLPRIGPALARRIVANRDSLGPFRSLDGLRRVKGIGPTTIALIGPLVTFSRQTRP